MNETPKPSDAEWEILKVLWDKGPMAARDVFASVSSKHEWGYKTVKTMLARLVKKGAITYDQIGNSYLYRPAFDQQEMTRQATNSFVQRVFDGALSPFLSYFAETITEEELLLLKSELRKIEKKRAQDKE